MRIQPVNSLTVDVEEWFHICGLENAPIVAPAEWRVSANIDKLLTLLANHEAKATFFVLGCVAQALPRLVPQIAAAGHEIASHGFSHRLVTELDPHGFRDELRRTRAILESQSGQKIAGFRAPRWSLSSATPWAFEILKEEGYRYDSSQTPLPFIGNPQGSRSPHRMELPAGSLWEIPPMVTPTIFGNMPTGGGWGLRFFPQWVVRRTIRDLNRAGAPAVMFIHPRELDPSGPRLRLGPLRNFAAYGPRTDVTERIDDLLRRFHFGTLLGMVEQWESA